MLQQAVLILWLQPGPCEQMWNHCIANCQRPLPSNALSCIMGCLGRWSAIKSWVNIQDLHTDKRDSQTSNHNDRKPQWAQCPHYPTSHCSLADTHQQCICMMICNTQSMNAVHHHDQTLLSSEQPLPVWHSQVPEQQPRLWDWIKLAPQSNPTDTKVLGESQKQRRV